MNNSLHYRCTTKNDHNTLLFIWERSVLKTHQFLKLEDFEKIKKNIPDWLPNLNVQVWYNEIEVIGFSATNKNNLEMLFLDEKYLGKGYGSKILMVLINKFSITTVDVNEQNVQAYNFYCRNGFKVISKSENDGMNMPYPLLHLSL